MRVETFIFTIWTSCCILLWLDMKDLGNTGFGGVKAKKWKASRRNILELALDKLVNFFYTLQGEASRERKHFQTSILFLRLS